MQRVSSLVSCEWLARILSPQTQYLRVLDGTWYLPDSGMDPKAEFNKKHIPGAEKFSIDECALPHSPYSQTLPTPEFFSEYVGERGICNNTHVVVYDNHPQYGIFSAARVWWLFRVFGHNSVSVLNGGLPTWEKAGLPVMSSTGPSEVEKQEFKAELQPNLVKRFADMTGNLDKQNFQVMDARSKARFLGQASEPREGIHLGHMRGASNVPFMSLLNDDEDSENPRLMKSPEELATIFADRGIDLSGPVTATCGSGVTACILALAAHQTGKKDVAVYDGSWEEYSRKATEDQVSPVEERLAGEGFTVHQEFFLEDMSGPEKDLPNLDISVTLFSPSQERILGEL